MSHPTATNLLKLNVSKKNKYNSELLTLKHLVSCKTVPRSIINPALVAAILREGADVNGPVNESIDYPLHVACEHCKYNAARLLLHLGPYPKIRDKFGLTLLLKGCLTSRGLVGATLKIMLKHLALSTCLGIEMNQKDRRFIESETDVSIFYKSCLKELNNMKTIEVADGFKYFGFFSKTSYELAVLLKNPSTFDQLKRSLLPCKPEKFPNYKTDLVAKFGVARQMCSMLVAKERELENTFGGFLPVDVLHKLAFYSLDLKNFEREYYLNKFS